MRNFTKKRSEIIHDLFARYRNPFFCFDCNENKVWIKSFSHSTVLTTSKLNNNELYVTPSDSYIETYIHTIIKNDDLMCDIQYIDKSHEYVFPFKYANNYIYAYGDSWFEGLKDAPHSPNDIELLIPLYKVEKISQAYIYQDYYESDPIKPMYGFKAMVVSKGIISNGYELGVAKEVDKRPNPYLTDYQDCYLHYCENLEDPLLYWYRDFIAESLQDHQYPSHHLFKVKVEGHYFKHTEHGWVTNKITLIEEVSKANIITYLEQNPLILEEIKAYWTREGKPHDLWEKYKETS